MKKNIDQMTTGEIWYYIFGFGVCNGHSIKQFSEITRESIALIERKKISDATPQATKKQNKKRGL
jgi:hypothetical protein